MPRQTAWTILRSGAPAPLREVDAASEARGLDARDRAFVRILVGTEVRRRATLRALLRRFCSDKPSPELATHLHLGLVQAYFLDRIPDHALVSETVELVRAACGQGAARVANAVLREALRQRRPGHVGDPVRDIPLRDLHVWLPVFHDPRGYPLLWVEDALSMPAPLVKRWEQRYGAETARAIALWALEEPDLSIVSVRGERDALRAELVEMGVAVHDGTHPAVLLAPAAAAELVASSAALREGRATIQGESALRAAEAMQAQPGEELLDLCAAPGGKTAVLARSGARVTACDVSEEKLARLRSTLARLGLTDKVELIVSDGTRALDASRTFDGVLIDAPCTNTGVLAQRPEARWRFGPKSKADLTALQARLFAEGAERVRPGGRLVWSTCSLEPDENARQVRTFLADHPEWTLEEEHAALPDVAQPRTGGPIDGGYFARVRRAGPVLQSRAVDRADTPGARRTLVTGASSGIGEAVARACAERGDRVALLARRERELERVAASLPRPEEHLVLPCDVGDEVALARSFARVEERFGALDLLVNNAGVGYRALVEELEAQLVRHLLDVNVTGLVMCCKHALPLLRRGRDPVVVNISSVVGRRGFPGQAVYAASKAAVCSISEALRLEWAEHGIEVCTLNPSTTNTGFFAAQPNPRGLPLPDLARATPPSVVARAVLELDREPRPEVFLAPRWKWIGVLSLLAPRKADRILAQRLGRASK